MRPKKTLSNWLTTKYLLIIRNEDNFAEKTTFSFNYAKLVVFIFCAFFIFLLVSLYLVNTVLSQWFDPRHAEIEANKQIIQLSLSVDSLKEQVNKKEVFIQNIQNVLKGDDISNDEDSQPKENESKRIQTLNAEAELYDIPKIDSQFRTNFEESGIQQFAFVNNKNNLELDELFLFSPISGVVSDDYDAKNEHYGIDIVSKRNEPVKSVADGTIIFSSWTQDAGYVMTIQHRSNLISVYKHNSELLKEVGNFVSAGEVISTIGNTGELTTGPHLHFELWYNGNPMNPEDFVSF